LLVQFLLVTAIGCCAFETWRGGAVWESNSQAQAVTPHVCSGGAAAGGSYKCQGTECGDNDKGERDKSICDKSGCDFNPYRLGETGFYGNSSSFKIDTTKPFTVVTQWITDDGTDTGNLVEIRRKYVQNGQVFENPKITVGGKQYDSVTDDFCDTMFTTFNDTNAFGAKGGMKAMGDVMKRGMVLVMSLWDDTAVNMLWLDSVDPPVPRANAPPGAIRGPCSVDSGKPDELQRDYPAANVIYSDIKYGTIGSTYPGGTPGPSPPPGPGPAPPPAPGGCPGGTLSACMDLCPSSPPVVYKDCIVNCGKRCPPNHHEH
jgi:cellulose 1,4-beta-cellobiosidase